MGQRRAACHLGDRWPRSNLLSCRGPPGALARRAEEATLIKVETEPGHHQLRPCGAELDELWASFDHGPRHIDIEPGFFCATTATEMLRDQRNARDVVGVACLPRGMLDIIFGR